jgi:hypothetical protein
MPIANSAEDEVKHSAQCDGDKKGNDEFLTLQAECAYQQIDGHQGTGKRNGGIEIGKGDQQYRREILCRFLHHHNSHEGEIDAVVQDQEIGDRRNITPGFGTEKAVQQRFNGDMALGFEGHEGPHKTDPDEQDARHLFRPGNGTVENIPADHLGKDERIQCHKGNRNDPVENFLCMILEEHHLSLLQSVYSVTPNHFNLASCIHSGDFYFLKR